MNDRTDVQKIKALAAELAKVRKKAIKKYDLTTVMRWRRDYLDYKGMNFGDVIEQNADVFERLADK